MTKITASDRDLLESIYRLLQANADKTSKILRRLSALKQASKRGKSGMHERRRRKK